MKFRPLRAALPITVVAIGIVTIFMFREKIINRIKFIIMFQEIGANLYGYPEYKHRQTGIIFVGLKGGNYLIGAQKSDSGGLKWDPAADLNKGSVRLIRLDRFLIAKYEVTQEQWTNVMGSNPSKFVGNGQRPVEHVSWNDVHEFLAKTGLRLPTDAQWEYACKGDGLNQSKKDISKIGWYEENSGGGTHQIGSLPPNCFGIHDMYGNVWEWCEDVYNESGYNRIESEGIEPGLPPGLIGRVIRGGCAGVSLDTCGISARTASNPFHRSSFIGFRPIFQFP